MRNAYIACSIARSVAQAIINASLPLQWADGSKDSCVIIWIDMNALMLEIWLLKFN